MNKQQRIQEIFRRMEAAPAASDLVSALDLLSRTIDAVEDELTNTPNNPDNWAADGRIYPPQFDNARQVKGCPGVTRFRSRSHNPYIAANGAIEVQTLEQEVIFSKPGSNGQEVWAQ